MRAKHQNPVEFRIIVRRSGVVVESPSVEVFKSHVDMALRDIVSGHGRVGLGDLSCLFQS